MSPAWSGKRAESILNLLILMLSEIYAAFRFFTLGVLDAVSFGQHANEWDLRIMMSDLPQEPKGNSYP